MRPRGVLLRVPAALSRRTGSVAAAALALALAAPALAPGGALAVAARPAPERTSASPVDAGLPAPPGRTGLISQRRNGEFASGASAEPSISADGRYVAFTSSAQDLLTAGPAANEPGNPWIFVRDRDRGKTIRLPLPPNFPDGQSRDPSISADGNVVAWTFQSFATSLAGAPGSIVLAWDRATGRAEIASRNAKGGPADRSREPSVSKTGRYIAFTSENPSIARADGRVNPDVFRYDRKTKTTVLVSGGTIGGSAQNVSQSPSISANGNLIAFVSEPEDEAGSVAQVFVRNVDTDQVERVSAAVGGGRSNADAGQPSISSTGRYVAFASGASDLVRGDTNKSFDVFRRDRDTDTTQLVSVGAVGGPGNGPSGEPSLSADGRMVGFTSGATDLLGEAAAVTPGARLAAVAPPLRDSEVYERDMTAGATVLVSVATNGSPGGSRSLSPAVAGAGRFVVFASLSARLVRGDRLGFPDVFLRDFPPAPRLNPDPVTFGTRAVGSPPVPAAAVLTNTGWGPLAVRKASVDGPSDFDIVSDTCNGRVLYRAEGCTVTASFTARREGTRSGTLRIPDSYTGSPRTTRLRGFGSQARLRIEPTLGPPGSVVTATGSGFPARTQIRLSWSTGITPKMPTVTTDSRGRFSVQVLVFHNDVVGRRDLVAETVGRTDVSSVSVEMLVTRPSVGPPGFYVIRRLIDLPLVLLFRG